MYLRWSLEFSVGSFRCSCCDQNTIVQMISAVNISLRLWQYPKLMAYKRYVIYTHIYMCTCCDCSHLLAHLSVLRI